MKTSSKILMIAGLTTMALSCETRKPQAQYATDAQVIKMNFRISNDFTKSNPHSDTESMVFNLGDQVSVSSQDGTVKYEYGAEGWAPTDNYYFRWGSEGLAFHASHPTSTGTSYLDFMAPTNQSTLEKMADADYMTCDIPAIHNDGTGVLTFDMERRMSKVIYKLENIQAGNPVKGFKVGSYTGYSGGEPIDEVVSLTPYIEVPDGGERGGTGTKYIVLAVPGDEDESAVQISLTYKNQLLSFSGLPAREPGMMYEYTVNVEGPDVKISDPVVTPWTEDVIPGGPAHPTRRFHYFIKPGGTGSGETWEDAMGLETLRSLLSAKGSDSEAMKALDLARFHFAGGSYTIAPKADTVLLVDFKGSASAIRMTMDGGYDPSSTGTSLDNRDVTAFQTDFSGNGDRGIMHFGDQISLTVDGIAFSSAKFNASGSAVSVKGKSTITLNNVSLHDNSTSENGAAVSLSGSGSVLLATACTFSNNSAEKNGGALYVTNNSKVTLTDCKADHNSAVSGGFVQIYKGTVTVDGAASEYSLNQAAKSGGCFYLNHADASLNISDCRIIENFTTATSGSDTDETKGPGAGIFASNSSTVDVCNTYFYKNRAGDEDNTDSKCYGGAIAVSGGNVKCSQCRFEGNRGNRGSALMMLSSKGGKFTADRCAFYDNKQYSRGVCYVLSKNIAFFNRCSFYNNKLRGKSSAWGVICQTSANAAVCFNNCSANCPGNSYSSNVQVINADANLLLTNNTMIGEVVNGVVRTVSTGRFVAVNNVLINTKSGQKSIVAGSDNAGFYEGYNITGSNDVAPHEISATTKENVDASIFTWDAGSKEWEGWYTWAGPGSISFTGPERADVTAAYDNFAVDASGWGGCISDITNVGTTFKGWLESFDPVAYTVNQRGAERSGAYWPGSCQE